MKEKRKVISDLSDRKLRLSRTFIKISTIVLSLIILHDSVVHDLPFHYILFVLLGQVVGTIYKYGHRIHFDGDHSTIQLKTNRWALIFFMVLFLVRVVISPFMFDVLHLVHVSDALLLFHVGIYRSKWQVIIKQVDEMVYRYVGEMISKSPQA